MAQDRLQAPCPHCGENCMSLLTDGKTAADSQGWVSDCKNCGKTVMWWDGALVVPDDRRTN